MNQMVVTRMLHNLGLKYVVVDNGRLAVQACSSRDYDLVLMVRATHLAASHCICPLLLWRRQHLVDTASRQDIDLL